MVNRVKDSRIGIDARMLAHEKAVVLNAQLQPKGSKLFYPPQNLVDLIWKEKPPRSKEPVRVQPLKFAGMEAGRKLARLREWIKERPPTVPSYSKDPPKAGQMQVGTLLSDLPSIGKVPFFYCSRTFINLPMQRGSLTSEATIFPSTPSSTRTCSSPLTRPYCSSSPRRSTTP